MIKSEASVYKFKSQTLHLYGSCGTDNIKPYNIKSITIISIVIEKKASRRHTLYLYVYR